MDASILFLQHEKCCLRTLNFSLNDLVLNAESAGSVASLEPTLVRALVDSYGTYS
jgi:hypothetical protein